MKYKIPVVVGQMKQWRETHTKAQISEASTTKRGAVEPPSETMAFEECQAERTSHPPKIIKGDRSELRATETRHRSRERKDGLRELKAQPVNTVQPRGHGEKNGRDC